MCGSVSRSRAGRRVLLLTSVILMLGLSGALASDEPRETPLYDQAKTRAVESMDAPATEGREAGAENGPLPGKPTKKNCDVPTLSTEGTIVLIVALIGMACWLILRRKSPGDEAA
jgi:hypothetical protein